jgi:hypothetical protein
VDNPDFGIAQSAAIAGSKFDIRDHLRNWQSQHEARNVEIPLPFEPSMTANEELSMRVTLDQRERPASSTERLLDVQLEDGGIPESENVKVGDLVYVA